MQIDFFILPMRSKTPEAPHAPQGVPAGRAEVVEEGDD